MNNQNYRQNLRNPAGKPSADEPPQTQAESRKQEQPSNSRQNGPGQGGYRPGGLRFPIGNQQPYHAGIIYGWRFFVLWTERYQQ